MSWVRSCSTSSIRRPNRRTSGSRCGDRWFGRGFGTEATRLIVEHGLRLVGLRSIHLDVLKRNPRAVRTYEKVGFRRVKVEVDDGETWIEMEITP